MFIPLLPLQAPDIVLGDMEPFYHISHSELNVVQSSDNLLGDGSFGKVYKGKYRGRDVAVKVFMQGEQPLHTLLRQEVRYSDRLNTTRIMSLKFVIPYKTQTLPCMKAITNNRI